MEPNRSCSRQSCCGVSVEKGCFIFAVVNAVIVSLSVVGCLGFLGLILWTYLDPYEIRTQGSSATLLFFTGLCIVCCVGTAIAFIFAVLLCVGLSKKNPRYVKAYLVYGILTEVLSVGGVLRFIGMEWGVWWIVGYASIFLVACVVYAFLLVLVYRTHAVLANRSHAHSFYRHRKLANNYCESVNVIGGSETFLWNSKLSMDF